MSRQDLFERVVTFLLAQGEASRDRRAGLFRYRGPRGMKCALGCLIPDELYDSMIEGMAAREVLAAGYVPSAEPGRETLDLLLDLQDVHDNACVNDWPKCFERVAREYGLRYPDAPR